jgi:hypothetical protein
MNEAANMKSRIPTNAHPGLRLLAARSYDQFMESKDQIARITSDRTNSSVQIAKNLQIHLDMIGIQRLARLRRQTGYVDRDLERRRGQLHEQAAGKPSVTDAEQWGLLQRMRPAERMAHLLDPGNEAARCLALRQPTLDAQERAELLKVQLNMRHRAQVQQLDADAEAMTILYAGLGRLADVLAGAAAVIEPNARRGVRSFYSVGELNEFIARTLPNSNGEASAAEQREIDDAA